MDKKIVTQATGNGDANPQPTWAERHAAIMARVAGVDYKPAQHGPDFGHGVTRYNMPRCTTGSGKGA